MTLLRRARGWASNAQRVITTSYEAPNPITASTVAAVDRAFGAGMSGHTGTIRIGESASPAFSFEGYFPQLFSPGVAGSTGDVLRGPMTALPATAGPVAPVGESSPVADLLRNLGGGPIR